MGLLPGARAAHASPVRRVLDDARCDPVRGLAAAEAAVRLARDGPNDCAVAPSETVWTSLRRQLQDPLVLLLLAAAGIAAAAWAVEGAVGAPYDVLVIMVVVVANAVLATAQEGRSAHAVEALRALSVAPACVVRDGTLTRLDSTGVVVGDLLVRSEGDAVTADGRVVDATRPVVVEAALTGESDPVTKAPEAVPPDCQLADRTSMVFAGTAVASGGARVVVTATGTDTETGRVAGLLATATKRRSPLEEEVAAIGGTLARLVPAVAVVVVVLMLVTAPGLGSREVVAALLVGVSLAVAAVPEGLPAVVTLVLAVGMTRMAARNAVVRRLPAVETLGSTSVLCTDKTGTLTTGAMTVTAVVGALPGLPDRSDEVLRAALLAGDARPAVDAGGSATWATPSTSRSCAGPGTTPACRPRRRPSTGCRSPPDGAGPARSCAGLTGPGCTSW